MIRENIEWDFVRAEFLSAEPFNHVVIDDFWLPEIAERLYEEFPAYDSPVWNAHYNNAIENKKHVTIGTNFLRLLTVLLIF